MISTRRPLYLCPHHTPVNVPVCVLRAVSQRGGLPSLEHLNLSGCPLITEVGLQELVSVCPALNDEHFYYCDNIDGNTHSHTHTHTQTYTQTQTHTHSRTHTLTHILGHTLTRTHTLTQTLGHTLTHRHSDTQTHTHSDTHSLTDTHTHRASGKSKGSF